MSNDDFFMDKDPNLHYIHSRFSTKIDDILKRRQLKKSKEGTELKSDSFLSAEENWNKIENGSKRWNNNDNNNYSIENVNNHIDKHHSQHIEHILSKNNYETNGFLKNSQRRNVLYNDRENCLDVEEINNADDERFYDSTDIRDSKKNIFIDEMPYNENKIEKKQFPNNEQINEVESFVASRKQINDRYMNVNEAGNISYAKLKSGVTSYNSIVSENVELGNIQEISSKTKLTDGHDNLLIDKETDEKVNYNEENQNISNIERENSLLFKRKMEIYKTPSTEILLNKMKSNEEYEKQEETFLNLNKIGISNEIDMNKTPTKSYSHNYSPNGVDYIKYETAGKMNMSELETPYYMKEEEQGNTPFLAYYLAGKGAEEYVEAEVIAEDADESAQNINNKNDDTQNSNIHDNYRGNHLNEYTRNCEKNVKEIRNFGSINEYAKIHSKDVKEVKEPTQMKDYRKIRSYAEINEDRFINENVKETNIDETASNVSNKTNNKYYDPDIYKKICSSKKYNFLKTEEEYDKIMKKRSKIGNEINSGNKMKMASLVKEISFTDKQNSISPFNVMDSKSFKINFLNYPQTKNSENKLYSSNIRKENKIYGKENVESNAKTSKILSFATNTTINRSGENENEHTTLTEPDIYAIKKKVISKDIFLAPIIFKRNSEMDININKSDFKRNCFDETSKSLLDIDISDRKDANYTNKNNHIVYKKSKSFSENSNIIENGTKSNNELMQGVEKENMLLNFSKTEGNLEPLFKRNDYNKPFIKYNTLDETEEQKELRTENTTTKELKCFEENLKKELSNSTSPEYIKFLSDVKGTYRNIQEENELEEKKKQTNDIFSIAKGREREKEREREREREMEKQEIVNSFSNYQTCENRNNNVINEEEMKNWKDERILLNRNSNNYIYSNTFDNKNSISKKDGTVPFNMLRETADFGIKEIINHSSVESSSKKSGNIINIHVEQKNKLFDKTEGNNNYNEMKDSSFDFSKSDLSKIDASKIKKMILNSYSVSEHNLDIPFKILQEEVNTNDEINTYIKEQIRNGVNAVIEKILTDKEEEIFQSIENSISQKAKKRKEKKRENGRFKRELSKSESEKSDDNAENEKNKYINHKKKKESFVYSDSNNSDYHNHKTVNKNSKGLIVVEKICDENEKNYNKSDMSSNSSIKQVERKKKKKDSLTKIHEKEIHEKEIHEKDTHEKEIQQLDDEDLQEINVLNGNLKMNKVNKLIEISNKGIGKKTVNPKKIMYNCIDIIYHLLNEQRKKNNKLNNLMNEIENVNEYQKKIEKLTNENEHLKKEIELKNEEFKKKETKEKVTMKEKITEQANTISTYEKDIVIYKNKINKLNNKIGIKEKEIEKLKAQYQTVLEEVETCKTEATKTVKKILNKKNVNYVEKQYLDIAKYYEIQMHSLHKEIKNIKSLMKKETKENMLLVKKIKELEEMKKEKKNEDIEMEEKRAIQSENETLNVADTSIIKKKKSKLKLKSEELKEKGEMEEEEEQEKTEKEEETYKIKYNKLYKEMKEIKEDLEKQKRLYDEKISHLEQTQEMQNMKNQLNATEKIVQLYQTMFKEKVNNLTNGDSMLGVLPNDNKDQTKNDMSVLHFSDNPEEFQKYNSYIRQYSSKSNHENLNHTKCDNKINSSHFMENMFLENDKFTPSFVHEATPNSIYQNDDFDNTLFGINKSTSAIEKSGRLFSSKRFLTNNEKINPLNYTNHLIGISNSLNNNILKDCKYINHEHCLNSFIKLYIEHSKINDMSHLEKEFCTFQKNIENVETSQNFLHYDPSQNECLYKNLLNYEKEKLIEIFLNICNGLKTDNIFIIVQYVKYLSFIVYEQFPLFTSFYYSIASLASIKSIQFKECIEIVKKWKTYYVHGKKLYSFRKNVLLIFKSDLQNVKKEMIDKECVNMIKNIYDKNSDIDKFSKDSSDKAEYIINKHAKELISKIIKNYMNIYNIEKISNIIAHMNSMHNKFKTQSYFVRSVSTCLNLNKTDNLQEIEDKIKDLILSKEIGEKLKNKIKIEDIDDYLTAYTILNTLKKYLNISQTKDLLPSISKIIQKNRSLHI